jgi:23S rRNA (cytidine1920-2'-O)/16S rRNA (cytidine1409-2'-O)-methyltransferase
VARRRLDAELVRRGLVASRTEAQDAVRGGLVLVAGRTAEKASTLVDPGDPLDLVAAPRRFVSRGGEKLDAALGGLGVAVEGRRCLDAGASTGGFTDRLLRSGAAAVIALDVGYGQLAWSLRQDPRVTVLERTNIRDVRVGDLPYAPDLVVADLSFISLRLAVEPFARVAAEGAELVLLVKPQFEAGREDVGRGGVVRDPDIWRRAVLDVAEACRASGFEPRGVLASPIRGPAGNVEFLLHAVDRRATADGGSSGDPPPGLADAIEAGEALVGAS